MNSPVINDEWVAIKEFPFLSGKQLDLVDGSEQLRTGNKQLEERGGYNAEEGNEASTEWTLDVKWLEDFHVIQISSSNRLGAAKLRDDADPNSNSVSTTDSGSAAYIAELTVDRFVSIHEQICLLCSSLKESLPSLPVVPRGIWSFVSSVQIPDDFEDEMLAYLQNARQELGEKIFLENFFEQDTVTEEEFLENLGDLNRKAFAENVESASLLLDEVLSLREGSINIHDMVSLYSLEDEAMEKLEVAKAVLYNFDRQPFLDLREVSHHQLGCSKKEICNESITEDLRLKLADDIEELRRQLAANEENLLDLQLQFFESSLNHMMDCRDRMIDDERRFGKEDFQNSSAKERLQKISKDVANLSAQLLRSRRIRLLTERAKIRCELVTLEENESLEAELEKLEKRFFKKQMEIYQVELNIVEEEEKLLRLFLKEFFTEEDIEEVDVFFETFEEQPEGLDEEEFTKKFVEGEDCKEKNEDWKKKQDLTKNLNRLFRKRAWLRNRKRKCESDMRGRLSVKQQAEENFKWHHSIQIKRDKRKEELEKKKDFIQEVRKKTIERLKSFKQKYPEPVVKRPPRYLPPVRRTRSGRASPSPSSSENRRSSISNVVARYEVAKRASKARAAVKQDKCEVATDPQVDGSDSVASHDLIPPPPPPPAPPPPILAPPPPPPPPPVSLVQKMEVTTVKAREGPAKRSEVTKSSGKQASRKSDNIDISQIILARRNLRKNVEGSSEEKGCQDVSQDIMSMIRSGVKLKKVDKKELARETGLSDIAASMLRNTLAKMNKHMAESSDEEDDAANANDDYFS